MIMRRTLAIVTMGLAAAAALLATPGTAFASGSAAVPRSQSHETTQSATRGSRVKLKTVQQEGVSPGVELPPGGSGGSCYGVTLTPWLSGGTAWGEGETYCAVATSTYVQSTMTRGRWWGSQYLASDASYGIDSADALPHYSCAGQGTFTYSVASTHIAWVNGDKLAGVTANSNRFAC